MESAASRGVAVVRYHRKLLARLLAVADVTLEELENMIVISRETLEKKRGKHQAALLAALTKARQDGIKTVSHALSRVIPLERQAYSLDDDQGGAVPIKYVAPGYDKPAAAGLPEDDWGDDAA